jgi:hypothetical protein
VVVDVLDVVVVGFDVDEVVFDDDVVYEGDVVVAEVEGHDEVLLGSCGRGRGS